MAKSKKKVQEKKKGLTENQIHYNLLLKTGADEDLKNIINGKYILLKELGSGADAIVFKAKERDGGRTVALKFIINKCRNSVMMMGTIREIMLMRRLNEISSMLYKA